MPANVDERRHEGESPVDYVRRLAIEKAAAIATAPDTAVLAADTTVDLDGEALEKPDSSRSAIEMLTRLSGRKHLVHTGVCIQSAWAGTVDVSTTEVEFAPIPQSEIEAYVATGHPMDKAGAYGIQGWPSRWVRRIDGCYFNIVGLPVSLVWQRLREVSGAA